MSNSKRVPFNIQDRNKYLYQHKNFEPREASLKSYLKIKEIGYEKYNQIMLSNILDPKSAGNTAKKQNNYESDKKELKENNNNNICTTFNALQNDDTKILIQKKLQYKTNGQISIESMQGQLRSQISALKIQNEKLQNAINEKDYQYRSLQNKYTQLQQQRQVITSQIIQLQKNLSEQIKNNEMKLEESYEAIKKMYEKNTALNQQISNLKKQISILQKKQKQSDINCVNQINQSNKLKNIASEYTQKQIQIIFNQKKQQIQQNIIKEQALKNQKITQQLTNLYEQKKKKYEEQIRSLTYEISRLKAGSNIKSTREKQFEFEIKKNQSILKTKDNQNKEQFKKYEKKIQELENEKNAMINNLMRLQKQKQQILEDHKILIKGHRDKFYSLQQSHLLRQKQLEIKNNQLIAKNQKQQQKIEKISNENLKLRSRLQSQIEQLQKSHKLQVDIMTKNFKQVELNIQNYESTLKNLRNQNSGLKQEISTNYKSILMFQDKIKAYQRQISILSGGLKSKQSTQRQYQQRIGNIENLMNYRKRTQRLQTSKTDNLNYQSKQRFSIQRKQYEQQIQRRRKLNNYPSSNMISRQRQNALDMSYESKYKYNQRNVNLPLRRNKMVPRNSLDHNKNLLNEQGINEVIKKCNVLRTHH